MRAGSIRRGTRSTPRTHARPMSGVTPARRVAFAVVRRVFEEGAYADRALHGEAQGLDPRERALAMQLAYGTVQRKLTLDHLIEQLARPRRASSTRRRSRRCGSGSTSSSSSTASPPTPPSARASSWPRAGAAAGTSSSTPSCGAPRAASCPRCRPTTRRPARRSRTPTRRGSSSCGGSASAPDETRALLRAGNEPGELALRVNTLRASPAEVAAALGGYAGRRTRGGRRRAARGRSSSTAPSTRTATRSTPRAPTRRSRAARCSSRARSTRSPASACSTSAPRPAARRRTSPR